MDAAHCTFQFFNTLVSVIKFCVNSQILSPATHHLSRIEFTFFRLCLSTPTCRDIVVGVGAMIKSILQLHPQLSKVKFSFDNKNYIRHSGARVCQWLLKEDFFSLLRAEHCTTPLHHHLKKNEKKRKLLSVLVLNTAVENLQT